MATEDYSKLLREMPRISKVVNAFSSDAVQHAAFDALVAALKGNEPSDPQRGIATSGRRKPADQRPKKKAASKKHSAGKIGEKRDSKFDFVRFAGEFKSRSDYAAIADKVLNARDLWNKIRLVLYVADSPMTSGDIHKTLGQLRLKSSRRNISTKLKDKGRELITDGVRKLGSKVTYKLSQRGKGATKKWLNKALK